MEGFFEEFRVRMKLDDVDVRQYSPLSLAYIGDSIYDVMVKFYLVSLGNRSVNQFHKLSKGYVKASEQAAILERIRPILSEEELKIVKRGRNAKSQTMPKNATRKDYQMATAFECLLGYLLLNKEYQRLMECVVTGIEGHGVE